MPDNRVDTTRPEYSWIPFFEELARRLHEDGWRNRQPEIVAGLKTFRENGYRFNRWVTRLDDNIDPFSVFALLCTNLGWDERSRLFTAYRELFQVRAQIPVELPTVPILWQNILYCDSRFDRVDVATHWRSFEMLVKFDFETRESMTSLASNQLQESLDVNSVAIAKLSMALFWIRPYEFAHLDTITAALARAKILDFDEPSNAKEYLDLLTLFKKVDHRPIPEVNVSEYAADQFRKHHASKRVWRILAWVDHRGVSEFLDTQSAKVHYGIHDVDFAQISSGDELRQLLRREKPDLSDRVLTQLVKFGWEAERGDVVVMPTGETDRVHVGFFTSDGAFLRHYDGNPQPINHRSVAWRHELVVPGIPTRSTFVEVDKAADDVRRLLLQAEGSSADEEEFSEEPTAEADDFQPFQWPSEEVFLDDDEQLRMLSLLQRKQNLILQGPPGTGKTFIARRLAYALLGAKDQSRVASVQFHQSYSYEDFVGGLRPDVNADDQLVFNANDGTFLRLCEKARDDESNRPYVMLIDEVNRGNLSRVFGELMMLIEPDKREEDQAIDLPHRAAMVKAGDAESAKFHVPKNVYIIGTMNLADRSLTGMNVAMRRRFGFVDLRPQFGELRFDDWLAENGLPRDDEELSRLRNKIIERMTELNRSIQDDRSLGAQYAVGHSFFCPAEDDPVGGDWDAWYMAVIEHEIKPLLKEYWFDQPEKAEDAVVRLLND